MEVTVELDPSSLSVAPATLAGQPVILRAVRPRGPFETGPVQPAEEWVAETDTRGVAHFRVPAAGPLASGGLRLQAVTVWNGAPLQSPAVLPAEGVQLPIRLMAFGHDPNTVRLGSLRLVVEPWEDYLVMSQQVELTVEGDQMLDTTNLPGKRFEKGLPIRLPVKAQGIQVMGPGEHKVVNSTVYWSGVLRPNQPVSLQLRYSMSVTSPRFTYEQLVDYPVAGQVQIIVPLETRYRKVPATRQPGAPGAGLSRPRRAGRAGRPLRAAG